MQWIKYQWLRAWCLWMRYKHRNDLVRLVFDGATPELGEVLTDTNGVQLTVVSEAKRDGNQWIVITVITHTPEPVNIDFVSDELPEGSIIWMNGYEWVKMRDKEFILRAYKPFEVA